MAFSPIDLAIQEILLTNFVTDIASISNANSLILKEKIEDIVNQFEIDTTALSIGTSNPISSIRTDLAIFQDTGFVFQTGTPIQVIARLEKNVNGESVLTVDNLNINLLASIDDSSINSLTVNDSLTIDGAATANSSFECKAAMIDSKETIAVPLTLATGGSEAEATITLTSTSKRHIFVTLNAVTSPALNFVYDGAGGFGSVTNFIIYLDFDADNPPTENTSFTIHLVDIKSDASGSSILADVNAQLINTSIQPGENLSTTPASTILLHNGGTAYPGINTTLGSPTLLSNAHSYYGHSLTVTYVRDENLDDRLIVNSMVGLEFF